MSYTPPAAREGVYFTRNLTAQTRADGEALVARYWQNSILGKLPYYPITNYPDLLNFLDSNYPTFVESLGDQLNQITLDKMNAAMDDVAANGKTSYPRPSDFASGIEKEGGTIDYTTVLEDTASDVASEVVNFTQGFFTVLVVVIVVVVAGVAYYKSGGKIPKLNLDKLKAKLPS